MSCEEWPLAVLRHQTGPDGEVEVWLVDLGRHVSLISLSPGEISRVRRCRGPHRQRLAAAFVATRQVLASHLGMPPAEVPIDRTCRRCWADHGPPRLGGAVDEPLAVATSRSRSVGLLAVGRARRLAVDVEWLRPIPHPVRTAHRHLAPSGAEAVSQVRTGERSHALLQRWTRAEAVLKASGRGLSAGTRWLEISDDADPFTRVAGSTRLPGAWWVEDLPAGPHWVGALAVAT